MLNIFSSLVVYLIEMLIAYIVFSYVSSRKRPFVIVLLIGIIIFGSGATVNYVFSNTVWLNVIYTVTIIFLFAISCFRINVRTAALYAFLMTVLSLAFEFATIFIISALAGGEVTDYNSDFLILVIETAICKTLYFVSCIILLRFLRSTDSILDRIPASFYLYPLSTLLAFLVFWYICSHEVLSGSSQIFLATASIMLLASTVILFITYRHNVEKDSDYIRIKSDNERLITEKAYYDVLEHQNQQLMIYAHDTKKHLAAIQNLSTDPIIDDYVQKLSSQLKSYTAVCHSGNTILDVLVNKYVTECELRKVSFFYDVRQCNLIEVEDIDIVAILGNLLDNALTSAEQSAEKSMSIATTWRNNYSVVIIKNSCDHEPKVSGNLLLSTKSDRAIHGFGLRSVKNKLKNYQGDYSWEFDSSTHQFIVTVMIGKKRINQFEKEMKKSSPIL